MVEFNSVDQLADLAEAIVGDLGVKHENPHPTITISEFQPAVLLTAMVLVNVKQVQRLDLGYGQPMHLSNDVI